MPHIGRKGPEIFDRVVYGLTGGLQSRFFPGNAGFQPAGEFVGILPAQGRRLHSATFAQAGSLRCNPPVRFEEMSFRPLAVDVKDMIECLPGVVADLRNTLRRYSLCQSVYNLCRKDQFGKFFTFFGNRRNQSPCQKSNTL